MLCNIEKKPQTHVLVIGTLEIKSNQETNMMCRSIYIDSLKIDR